MLKSAARVYLEKHGWHEVSRKRMGCMIIARWGKQGVMEGCNQEQALQIERGRQKWLKLRRVAGAEQK
jgi:hypothetical protein